MGYVALVVALMPAVQASTPELQVYFHLHQAYEFLEAREKDGCPWASSRSESHLHMAEEAMVKSGGTSVFAIELERIKKLVLKTSANSPTEIERVRMDVQRKADALKLRHERAWHDEIRSCSERLSS